jgi:hypothetical protein
LPESHEGSDEEENNNEDTEEDEAVQELRMVQALCLDLHRSERTVYERLLPLQGSQIPNFLASVHMEPLIPCEIPGHLGSNVEDYIFIPGVLIEYIDGFCLENTKTAAPKEHWEQIFGASIDIANKLGDYDVLNQDVRPENMIVRETENGVYQPVMIDFAQARVRRNDECDQEWREHKCMQDEEGAIGLGMRKELGLEFEYSEAGSLRYSVLAKDLQFY